MNVKLIDVGKINPAPYNPRVELLPGDPEYAQIEASLDEFGLVEPLVWNEANGVLVGGHQRFNILKAQGRKKVHVSVVRIEDEQREKALNVALNQTGRWDVDKLGVLLGELDVEKLRLASGLNPETIERLRVDLQRNEALDALGALDPGSSAGKSFTEGKEFRPDTGEFKEQTFTFTPAQFGAFKHAVELAKEQWGCPDTVSAMTAIFQHFSEQATPNTGADQ